MSSELATFAGGCYWCMAPAFEDILGVKSVVSGFMGGLDAPNYQDIRGGNSDHLEVIQIEYDPEICSYEELLDLYWRQVDPTDDGGQFEDRGYSYLTAIFYHSEEQRRQTEASVKALDESGVFDKPVVTMVLSATTFYPAAEDQQDYYKKNPVFYCEYRSRSGRDDFIKKVWDTPVHKK